jgi:ribosomal-protein-alanine N-acetyltransferase
MDKQITIVETERLLLRRLQPSDVPALIDLWSDPDVTKHMGGPRERAKLESIFEEDVKDPFAEEFDLWPVVEKETQEVIGHCGLLEKEVDGREEIEVNYIFKPSAWGKGYASEIGRAIIHYAFEEKKLPRLIALIEPDNEPSERVAVKIGMRFEKEVVRPGGAKRKFYVIEAKSQAE